MNFVQLIFAVVVAACTFVHRLIDRCVLALEMAYLSHRRRQAAREHGALRAVPNGPQWLTRSGENC